MNLLNNSSYFKVGLLAMNNFNNMLAQQVRTAIHGGWTDWRMYKDNRKRKTVTELSAKRTRVNTIRKNDILPREIQEIADIELHDMPRDSMYTCVVPRCVISSRTKLKGPAMKHFHISRMQFRLLADYNKIAGVRRAAW